MGRKPLESFETPLTVAISKYMRAREDAGETLPYGAVLQRLVERDPSLSERHMAFTDFFAGLIDLRPEHLSNSEDRRLMAEQLRAMRHPAADLFDSAAPSPAAGWGPVLPFGRRR